MVILRRVSVRSLALCFCLALIVPRVDAGPAPREAFSLVVELLKGTDPDLRGVALERVREGLVGKAYSIELAEQVLPTLPADVQARLITALAGRRDPAALPGLVSMAAASDPAVVTAAIRAIAEVGGGDQVPLLLARLGSTSPVREAARVGLVTVQAPDVSPQLLTAAVDESLPPAARAEIFGILAERRDREAVRVLLPATRTDDPLLRSAAMRALGRLGGPGEVPGMLAGFLATETAAERDAAERAILAVCGQQSDAKAATAAVLMAYRTADPAAQEMLLPLLARVGGPEALAIVDGLLADPDPARRARGLVALSRWPDAAVTDRLLGLLARTSDEGERRLIINALIRIAPIPNNGLSDAQRLALLAETMKLSTADEDHCRILERAGAIRTVETLRFIIPFLAEKNLAESAAKAVVELAHQQRLRDANKPEFTLALDQVLAVAKDPVTRERAVRYKEGKTWERR